MTGHVGDRLVVEPTAAGESRRVGVITGVMHSDGGPPYQVRWLEDGRTTFIFPGPKAHVEPTSAPA